MITSRKERRAIWRQVQFIWGASCLHGLRAEGAFRPPSRLSAISALLRLDYRVVESARLHCPQRIEAFWAAYSNMMRKLSGRSCMVQRRATSPETAGSTPAVRSSTFAGAHRPVQGAKGQVPSLPGEYARLIGKPVKLAGITGSITADERQREFHLPAGASNRVPKRDTQRSGAQGSKSAAAGTESARRMPLAAADNSTTKGGRGEFAMSTAPGATAHLKPAQQPGAVKKPAQPVRATATRRRRA